MQAKELAEHLGKTVCVSEDRPGINTDHPASVLTMSKRSEPMLHMMLR